MQRMRHVIPGRLKGAIAMLVGVLLPQAECPTMINALIKATTGHTTRLGKRLPGAWLFDSRAIVAMRRSRTRDGGAGNEPERASREAQVFLQGQLPGTFERPERVKRKVVSELFVLVHGAMAEAMRIIRRCGPTIHIYSCF